MNKYVVNHVIAGYREMSITDTRLVEGDNDIIVLILNQSTADKLTEYYNAVKNIFRKSYEYTEGYKSKGE